MAKRLLHEIHYVALLKDYEAEGHFLVETNSDRIRDGAIMQNLVYNYRSAAENRNKEGFIDFLHKMGIDAKIIEPDYIINV